MSARSVGDASSSRLQVSALRTTRLPSPSASSHLESTSRLNLAWDFALQIRRLNLMTLRAQASMLCSAAPRSQREAALRPSLYPSTPSYSRMGGGSSKAGGIGTRRSLAGAAGRRLADPTLLVLGCIGWLSILSLWATRVLPPKRRSAYSSRQLSQRRKKR